MTVQDETTTSDGILLSDAAAAKVKNLLEHAHVEKRESNLRIPSDSGTLECSNASQSPGSTIKAFFSCS